MPKANSDNPTIAEDPFLNIGVSENRLDIKVVLMALREEIMDSGIRVSNRDFPKGTNVVVPSLTGPFDVWYENDHVIFKRFYYRKQYKLKCEFEDGKISEGIIDILCALVEYYKLNEFRP